MMVCFRDCQKNPFEIANLRVIISKPMEPTEVDYEENVKNFITTHLTPRNLDGIVTVEAFDDYPDVSLTIPGGPYFAQENGVWRLIGYCGVHRDTEITNGKLFQLLDDFAKENQFKKNLENENVALREENARLLAENTELRLRPGGPDYLSAKANFESMAEKQ